MVLKLQNFKFGYSRFIFGTETGREVASLEWAGIRRDGKWLVLNAQDRKFSGFARKKFGTPKTRPGTQTSKWLFLKIAKLLRSVKKELIFAHE